MKKLMIVLVASLILMIGCNGNGEGLKQSLAPKEVTDFANDWPLPNRV